MGRGRGGGAAHTLVKWCVWRALVFRHSDAHAPHIFRSNHLVRTPSEACSFGLIIAHRVRAPAPPADKWRLDMVCAAGDVHAVSGWRVRCAVHSRAAAAAAAAAAMRPQSNRGLCVCVPVRLCAMEWVKGGRGGICTSATCLLCAIFVCWRACVHAVGPWCHGAR